MATSTAPEAFTRTTSTIPALFLERIGKTPDREAYRYPVGDEWRSLTWKAAGARVKALAAGLLSLGLGREDRVGILANTRYEWVLIDLGILCAGGATTTVYPSSTAEECAYILDDSASRFVFAEDAGQVAKLRGQKAAMPKLTKVILLDGAAEPGDAGWVMTLAELEAAGAAHLAATPTAVDDATAGVTREHLATLIYTSGTTGKPKGVRLMHDCWAYTADAIAAVGFLTDADLEYLWLPLSHSFGKVLTSGHVKIGHTVAIDGRIPKLIDNLAVVKPTMMAAAPRIFEKVYNKVVQGAKENGGNLKWKHLPVGDRRRQAGVGAAPEGPRAQGHAGVRVPHRDQAGVLEAAAALRRPAAAVRVGLGAAVARDRRVLPRRGRADRRGLRAHRVERRQLRQPRRQVQVRLGRPADAGHRGQAGARGRRDPAAQPGHHARLPQPADETAATLTRRLAHTGDIGEIDGEGFLKITDRKKDLIKTSGGKYVAPQYIEGKIKATCPFVSQVIVHGDKRNFCSALVTLDEEATKKWAEGAGLDRQDLRPDHRRRPRPRR
jgi:long-chain acyl-CoA synthetase